MNKFNVNTLFSNLKNAEKNTNDIKNTEIVQCFDYLQDRFNDATLQGKTSIIVDDNMKKKIYTHLNEMEDMFEKNGILLNYSDYPLIEIIPSPLYKNTNNQEDAKKRKIKFNFVVISSLLTVSTIISYFILDCIPFFNPFSHPIVFGLTTLIIMSVFGAVYSKFK